LRKNKDKFIKKLQFGFKYYSLSDKFFKILPDTFCKNLIGCPTCKD